MSLCQDVQRVPGFLITQNNTCTDCTRSLMAMHALSRQHHMLSKGMFETCSLSFDLNHNLTLQQEFAFKLWARTLTHTEIHLSLIALEN